MEDRVILDTMDDLGGPQGSYPEGFVSLSLFFAEIYKFVILVKKRDIRQTDMIHSIQTLEKFNINWSSSLSYDLLCPCMTMMQGYSKTCFKINN